MNFAPVKSQNSGRLLKLNWTNTTRSQGRLKRPREQADNINGALLQQRSRTTYINITMAENADIVDQTLTKTPTELLQEAGRAQGRETTAEHTKITNAAKKATQRLFEHLEDLQNQHRTIEPKLEKIAKELSLFRIKPNSLFTFADLPLNEEQIATVVTALTGPGMNVKNLQRSLGIFDYGEMTRKRKALQAAGVTKETENYQGTNATWIELNPTFVGSDESSATKKAENAA